MQQLITSRVTVWNKRAFPVLWFGTLALVATIGVATGAVIKNPMLLVLPCVMAAFGYFIMRKFLFDLVDEVFDRGDDLLVRNRGDEARIAIANIMNVNWVAFANPARITLPLREPCKLNGRLRKEVSFTPKMTFSFNPFRANAIAEDLILKVDRVRTGEWRRR